MRGGKAVHGVGSAQAPRQRTRARRCIDIGPVDVDMTEVASSRSPVPHSGTYTCVSDVEIAPNKMA